MKRFRFSILLLALCCWAGLVQAGAVGQRQLAACRDAVLGLKEFSSVDYDNISLSPDRIDKQGRAVMNWRIESRRIRANGFCRVQQDGEVAEIKIKEIDTPRPSGERHPRVLDGITMDVDTARHGDPYDEFETRNAEECARACLADDRCRAFNYRVSAGVCKVKEDFHETERERGVVSGEKTARQRVRMEIRRDYSLRGDPYRDFMARSFEQCRDACAKEERCIAFNYHTDDGACGLKDYVEERRRREGVISGEKVE